nr:reverse transcriptase domain-containing protein [Tanacetum cinerariifolium]
MKANDAILKNMQTNMTSLIISNLELKNMFGQFIKMNTASSSGLRTLPSNTITNPKEDFKGITTQSGNAYQGPTIPTTSSPPKLVERKTDVTKDTMPLTNNGSTKDVQPSVVQVETQILNFKPVEAPISALKPNPKPFTDALILMPKFGPTIKSLLTNKEKLFELARTPLNEHYSVVLLKKLPEKLGDPGKFLIPCDFSRMDECLALADLGASINLMPLSVWNKLSLPNCLLLTRRALIDVYEGELNLRVGNKAITFNLDQTSRYAANYDAMFVNRIELIDIAYEEYSQEFLGFSMSGNPTPSTKPIISTSSPTLTPFGDSDFLLEETDAFLAIDDEPISPKINESYYDSEGDILLLEEFLNDDPSSPPLPPQELKVIEPKNKKSSIDEPPVVELKDLPPHLEYAFLEGDDKLPVIIAKDLKDEEKTALIKVLKSHKQALTWQLSDIKGINPEFCTHKILIEDDFKPAVHHQRRVNPKIHKVIKKEVIKLLDAGLIYPISDSPWLSPTHCVPKKGGFTVIENE